jgi:intracellular multiplication protein IcmL
MTKPAQQQPKARPSEQALALSLLGRDHRSLIDDRDSWRNQSQKQWYAIAALVVIVAILATGLFRPETKVLGQVTDGRNSWVVPLMTLTTPHVHNNDVTNFAAEAATTALSYSFASWRTDLNNLDRFYLPDAAAQLKEGLAKTRFFTRLEETSSVTTAVPRTAPVIVAEQAVPGSYAWKVSLTMVVTWNGPSKRTEEIRVEMTVRQVQPVVNPRGVMIEQINIG